MTIVWPCQLGVDAYIEAGRSIEVLRPDCPDCASPMSFWSGYSRHVRVGGLCQKIFIRRVRCHTCQMSHALLPAFLFERRCDVVETIGEVIENVTDKAGGVRPIARRLGVPHTTARGWLRRFRAHTDELRVSFAAVSIELGARVALHGDHVPRDALEAIRAAFVTASDLIGWARLGCWRFVSVVCGGRLIATNTTSLYLIIGKRRFMVPVPFISEKDGGIHAQ